MENEVRVFTNEKFGVVRTANVNGEPWFVAKDIADILEYSDTNAMTKRLDNDETRTDKTSERNIIKNSMGTVYVNESGLYHAIIGSKKPEAKEFRKWVTSVVLPSVRQNRVPVFVDDSDVKNAIDINEVISTTEFAKQLKTTNDVILSNARKCLPDKTIENGKTTYWDKKEVTLIIDYMQKNNNRTDLTTFDTVSKVSTELTPALKIKQAMLLMQEGYEEELAIIKQRAETAEQMCIEQKPDVAFSKAIQSDEKHTFDMSTVAHELKLSFGKNILFAYLRDYGVLKSDNSPYQTYVDNGYFKVYVVHNKGGTFSTTKVTQKGVKFIFDLLCEQEIIPSGGRDEEK
jgi:prophage antirepressor-like protein/phage antirepressor YoqD-like protein